ALEPMQGDSFKAACNTFERGEVRARLGLPDPSSWPPAHDVAVVPLPRDEGDTGVIPADEARLRRNLGRPVFRVPRTRAMMWGAAGGALGMVATATLLIAVPGFSVGAALVLWLGLIAVGLILGRRRRRDFCADPACESILAADASTCPGCGGFVAGTIAHPSDRLAAEEALSSKPERP